MNWVETGTENFGKSRIRKILASQGLFMEKIFYARLGAERIMSSHTARIILVPDLGVTT